VRASRFSWAAAAALLALVLAALRALHLDEVIGGYTSCGGCFLVPALGHDAWLVGGLFLVLGASQWLRPAAARLALRFAAALLLLVQASDVETLNLFNQRFYFADLARFSGDAAGAWSVARAQLLSAGGLVQDLLVAGTIVVLGGYLLRSSRHPAAGRAVAIAGLLLFGFAAWASSRPFRTVHELYLVNVLEANLPPGRERAFSPAFAAAAQKQADAFPRSCTEPSPPPRPRNVVVVIVESLSAWQSALLGGPRDWLPRLDALARSNHYFTHFYANGFTTDGGEIALLTGRRPLIPDGSEWYVIDRFGAGPDTLPAVAHRAGAAAYYFTATDLSFLGTGAWLHQLGFDGVEGSESAFYAGMKRSQFGAPDDEALFARFEKWLDERRDDKPFVAVLLTVSSHPPFVDPRSGRIDPPGSFGYVDAQLAAFHDALAQRGFLDEGVLAILGDHRSMTPVPADEYRRFGERAYARIPLVVAGAVDLPAVVDAAFQQADLPASLARLYGVPTCLTPFRGAFLDAPVLAPRYVVHARGDDRDRVDVYSGDDVASYWLDGDDSHWRPAPPGDAAAVAAWIDAQRRRNAPAR
jgi:lipoteichoic acid synthase